jgi:hypothetical protein
VFLHYAGVEDKDVAVVINQYEQHQSERVFVQTLPTRTKNDKAQLAKVGLTNFSREPASAASGLP